MIPSIPRHNDAKPVYTLMNGGINTSVASDQIDANQMQDADNIWYRNKFLRQRPGMVKKIVNTYGKILAFYPEDGTTMLILDGKSNTISGIVFVTEHDVLAYDGDHIYSFGKGIDASRNFQQFDTTGALISTIFYGRTSGEGTGQNALQFIFDVIVDGKIYRAYAQDDDLILSSGAIYTPTIYVNMKASGSGDQNEGRNVLTSSVKVSYSTDGTSTLYKLPESPTYYEVAPVGELKSPAVDFDCQVFVEYHNLNDSSSYLYVFPSETTNTIQTGTLSTSSSTSVTVTLDREHGTVTFSAPLVDSATKEGTNNLIITYAHTIERESISTPAVFFGGSMEGQSSGTRIFCKYGDNKVIWSATTVPNYFSEDNINTVGGLGEKITEFGKNYGILAVFTNHSVHQISYYWDSTNQKSYFPCREINPVIGCDMPGSIQIINNRLVWGNTNGGLYTLASTQIQDERVVQPISRNINTMLLAESTSDMKNCSSADFYGYYLLFVGRHVYAWDYNTTMYIGYGSYTGYNDRNKSQNRLSWYRWTFPRSVAGIFQKDGKLCVNATDGTESVLYELTEGADDDDGTFAFYLKSKDFDMDLPTWKKLFYSVCVEYISKEDAYPVVMYSDDEGDAYDLDELPYYETETTTERRYTPPHTFTRKFHFVISRRDDDKNQFGIGPVTVYAKTGTESR